VRLFKHWQKRYRSLDPRLNLPTKLTILRIGLCPIFFILLMVDHLSARLAAFILFVVAAISDAYDGYLARKEGQVTEFGKIIDPIADKLLTTVAFIGFYLLGYVPIWIVAVILVREYFITLLRTVGIFKGVIIAADQWGKYKTIAQMTYIITQLVYINLILILHELNWTASPEFDYSVMILLTVMLYSALILTLGSGLNYLIHNRHLVRELFHG